jgi:hypothetical protein
MDDVLLHARSEAISQMDKEDTLEVNTVVRTPTKLSAWGIRTLEHHTSRMLQGVFKVPYSCEWTNVSCLQEATGIPHLTRAIAAFVQDKRTSGRPGRQVEASDDAERRSIQDFAWAEDLFISIHSSLTCWQRDGKDPSNSDRRIRHICRCQPDWNGRAGNWRRDTVWVQDENASTGLPDNIAGSYIGRLQCILKILDPDNGAESRSTTYTGAIVQLMKWRNNGEVHKIHGMAEVEPWPANPVINPRTLGELRVYDISRILHSAHVIPRGLTPDDKVQLVNSWINFEEYNRVYDPDFMENNKAAAKQWSKRLPLI